MTSSLILNKRIVTTLAKAKALRSYAEPLITKAKVDTTHARRTVFSQLQNKDSVSILFGEISSRISERPGGYTRIIKLEEVRPGDGSKMCMIELVDFNDIYKKPGIEKKHKTRKRRKKTPPPSTTVDGINTEEEEKPSVEKDNQPKKSE